MAEDFREDRDYVDQIRTFSYAKLEFGELGKTLVQHRLLHRTDRSTVEQCPHWFCQCHQAKRNTVNRLIFARPRVDRSLAHGISYCAGLHEIANVSDAGDSPQATDLMAGDQRNRTDERTQLQRQLAKLFADERVDITVGLLVLLSVALTLIEFSLQATRPHEYNVSIMSLIVINDVITSLFIVELFLRYWASSSWRTFLREYWIDVIAVLPLFRVFRAARAARLLRLIRVLRMFGVVSRLASHFPYIFRRGILEYLIVCGLLMVTVVFATGAILVFEGTGSPRGSQGAKDVTSFTGVAATRPSAKYTLERSFWFSLYSLLAGEPIPAPPRSLGGRIVTVFVMFMGMTIFAMFTGTVSAFMVERLRREGRYVDWQQLEEHVILCGWNRKAEIIVQEYRSSPRHKDVPIVAIAEFDGPLPEVTSKRVHFLNEDFTRVSALEKAGIYRANTCIVLSDTTHRSEQDADARTILAALTVEKLNPNIYTCAEVLEQSYASHLEMGHVNDYVISGEHSAYVLAQAALNRGMMEVFGELLTRGEGNAFHRLPVPENWLGREFAEMLQTAKSEHGGILIGVKSTGGRVTINPEQHIFSDGDEVVMIAPSNLRV